MNKQQLNVALALDRFGHGGDRTHENWEAVHNAARLVERLLPGECGNCHGDGYEHDHDWTVLDMACLVCHGSGRVWDEGIVEAVNKAIAVGLLDFAGAIDLNGKWSKEQNDLLARAVLSAIAELLTEKAGSQ